jgi:hypothetical protein
VSSGYTCPALWKFLYFSFWEGIQIILIALLDLVIHSYQNYNEDGKEFLLQFSFIFVDSMGKHDIEELVISKRKLEGFQ